MVGYARCMLMHVIHAVSDRSSACLAKSDACCIGEYCCELGLLETNCLPMLLYGLQTCDVHFRVARGSGFPSGRVGLGRVRKYTNIGGSGRVGFMQF